MPPDTLTLLRAGKLAGVTRLDLAAGLTEFPREIFELADSLEILNLSGNALTSLPDDLARLRRLRVLFCSENDFTRLPEVLGECDALSMVGFKSNRIEHVPGGALPAALRWLILTDNRVASLPRELGERPALQKLMLSGNALETLPDSMAGCARLEMARLAANRFTGLPNWLFELPRLAWLAFAGNPCSPAAAPTARRIPWSDLTVSEVLGEGASGVIHRAEWRGRGPAAVKLFKGAMTSDGLPGSEMAAALTAGDHPHLIGALGEISEHPDSARGLVMPLTAYGFTTLAGPPSLESCTRDLYPDGFRISSAAAARLAKGIASAAAHLHARGLLHGDLYAHNIQWRADGECLLGDFGAASLYDPADPRPARLEARAFGCLLEELLAHCPEEMPVLAELRDRCLSERVGDRPGFVEIAQVIVAGG